MKRQKLSLARTNSQQAIKTIQKLVHEQKNQEQTKTANCKFYFYSGKKVEEYYNSKKALQNKFWQETR